LRSCHAETARWQQVSQGKVYVPQAPRQHDPPQRFARIQALPFTHGIPVRI
jgi:hypothetical protein